MWPTRSARCDAKVNVSPGYQLVWSGQYEVHPARARAPDSGGASHNVSGLPAALPQYRFGGQDLIILRPCRSRPWAPIWLLHLLGYNMSIAVWVGLIALMGVDAETGGLHAALSRPLVRRGGRARPAFHLAPLQRGHRARRREARASQGDDRGLHVHRTASHHVVQRARGPM